MHPQNTTASDLQLYLRLMAYVKPYWRWFVVSIISMIILSATDPAIAALMKPLLDGGFVEKDPDIILLVPILIILLFTIRGIAEFASGLSLRWVANQVIMDMRTAMFDRLLALPSQYYDHQVSGRLISKFSYDVTQIKNAASNAITVAVRDTLTILGLLCWMLYLNWELTLISLFSAPAITVLVLVIRKRLRKMGRRVQSTMADISHVLNESIHNHKLIKLFGGKKQEESRFNVVNDANRRYMVKFAVASVATGPGVQLIAAIIFAVIVYIATQDAVKGTLTVGEFISFIAALTMLLTPLRRLVRINEFLQKALAASESIFSLLDMPVEQDTGNRTVKRLQGVIEFRNVSFRYEKSDTPALQNISMLIRAGETVALVGSSGSGKTTIASLLPAFYQVTDGQILLDDCDIREYTLETLRNNIALVSQEIYLFNDTVRNNIAYGSLSGKTEAEIVQAATAANAMEFIKALPDGLDTLVGEKGLLLSGGQRQRIAIARALLKDAPILILDEATSSLDTESERSIQAALDRIRKNRTCIIIAHRLTTIENADRILVIDDGRIVQTGTHRELLEQNGVYARLHQMNTDTGSCR